MFGEKRLKCTEYTRREKSYIDMEWDIAQRVARETKENLKTEEQGLWVQLQRLSELQTRVARKRRIWELAQTRADKQTACLIEEMETSGEDLTVRSAGDALAASVLEISLNDIDWGAFGPSSGDDAAVPVVDPTTPETRIF